MKNLRIINKRASKVHFYKQEKNSLSFYKSAEISGMLSFYRSTHGTSRFTFQYDVRYLLWIRLRQLENIIIYCKRNPRVRYCSSPFLTIAIRLFGFCTTIRYTCDDHLTTIFLCSSISRCTRNTWNKNFVAKKKWHGDTWTYLRWQRQIPRN